MIMVANSEDLYRVTQHDPNGEGIRGGCIAIHFQTQDAFPLHLAIFDCAGYPQLRSEFFRMLDHNEADAMLTLDRHVYHKDYIIAKEARLPVHFVAGADCPLAGRKGLSIRDLISMPFILTERGMGYRRTLDETLSRMSLEIQPVLEISRTDIITSLIEHGGAISFLPDFVTRKKVAEGALVHLDVADVEIDIWQQLIYHRSKWMSKALDAFLRYVAENEFSR